MPLYRVIRSLWAGPLILAPGSLSRLAAVPEKARQRLVDRGTIRLVDGPPLTELPTWGVRGRRLAAEGIVMAGQFLDADPEAIADAMRVSPSLICRWQAEAEGWLTAPPPLASA